MAQPLGRSGLFLALVGALALAGCQLSSSQRYQVASNSYDAALMAFTAASLSGEVSLEDMERFQIIRLQADELLNEWETAINNGEEFDGFAEFQIILNRLIMLKLELEEHDAGGNGSSTSSYEVEPGYHGGHAVSHRAAA